MSTLCASGSRASQWTILKPDARDFELLGSEVGTGWHEWDRGRGGEGGSPFVGESVGVDSFGSVERGTSHYSRCETQRSRSQV